MATASTGIVFNATAINKTGRVFREITSRALSVGKSIAKIGAGFAVGGVTAIGLTAKKLGELSDVAMRAGLATDEITKMSTAFDVLGIKASTPDQIAAAMQKMAKTTGETGVAGFEKVIASISQMGTVEERASAAMAVFGRTGMEFMPLIEAAAKNGTAALHDVIDAVPGVSQAAADAGDKMADAITVMTNGLKATWYEFCGDIISMFDENFEGGIRQAAMNAVAYIDYFVKASGRYLSAFSSGFEKLVIGLDYEFSNLFIRLSKYIWEEVKAVGGLIGDLLTTGWWDILTRGTEPIDEAFERFQYHIQWAADNVWKGIDLSGFADVMTSDLEINLQNKLEKAAKGAASVGAAAVSLSANTAANETANQIQAASKAAKTDFLTADTYRAATMSIRADYGQGEGKTVKAVNGVKAVNEKIQRAVEKTADALTGLEMLY